MVPVFHGFLFLKPKAFKNNKEPKSEIGTVTIGIKVALKLPRNKNTITSTKIMASIIEDLILVIEERIKEA